MIKTELIMTPLSLLIYIRALNSYTWINLRLGSKLILILKRIILIKLLEKKKSLISQ